MRRAVLLLAALALTACESSQEQNAKLERVAKREAAETRRHVTLTRHGLSIAHESRKVSVIATAILHSAEGTAAVVTLRNLTSTALRDIPIAINVESASGKPIYQNNAPGLTAALVSEPLLAAHSTATWIDDQVPAGGSPKSVSARVGEGETVTGTIPALAIQGTHLVGEPTSGIDAEGSVTNHSSVSQSQLVVYALARRHGVIVAAGRAVVPLAPAGSSTRFQVYFIGEPTGATLEISAPASTVG